MSDEELLNELEKTEIQRESVKKLLVEEILKKKLMMEVEVNKKVKEIEKLIFQKDKENRIDLESKKELVVTRKFIYKCLLSDDSLENISFIFFLRIISAILVFFSIALALLSLFLTPTILMIIASVIEVKGENPDRLIINKDGIEILNDKILNKKTKEYIMLESVDNYELKNILGKNILFIYFKNRVLELDGKQYHNFDEIYPFLEKLRENSI